MLTETGVKRSEDFGLVYSSIQVLLIRYFQRQCNSYNCRMLVGPVFDSYVQVIGIRYFHELHIIVVYQWVLSLMYKY